MKREGELEGERCSAFMRASKNNREDGWEKGGDSMWVCKSQRDREWEIVQERQIKDKHVSQTRWRKWEREGQRQRWKREGERPFPKHKKLVCVCTASMTRCGFMVMSVSPLLHLGFNVIQPCKMAASYEFWIKMPILYIKSPIHSECFVDTFLDKFMERSFCQWTQIIQWIKISALCLIETVWGLFLFPWTCWSFNLNGVGAQIDCRWLIAPTLHRDHNRIPWSYQQS